MPGRGGVGVGVGGGGGAAGFKQTGGEGGASSGRGKPKNPVSGHVGNQEKGQVGNQRGGKRPRSRRNRSRAAKQKGASAAKAPSTIKLIELEDVKPNPRERLKVQIKELPENITDEALMSLLG